MKQRTNSSNAPAARTSTPDPGPSRTPDPSPPSPHPLGPQSCPLPGVPGAHDQQPPFLVVDIDQLSPSGQEDFMPRGTADSEGRLPPRASSGQQKPARYSTRGLGSAIGIAPARPRHQGASARGAGAGAGPCALRPPRSAGLRRTAGPGAGPLSAEFRGVSAGRVLTPTLASWCHAQSCMAK